MNKFIFFLLISFCVGFTSPFDKKSNTYLIEKISVIEKWQYSDMLLTFSNQTLVAILIKAVNPTNPSEPLLSTDVTSTIACGKMLKIGQNALTILKFCGKPIDHQTLVTGLSH